MAAPLQQMPSQLIPGGSGSPGMDFSQYAFNSIREDHYTGPVWQATVAISERAGKAHELITAAVLALPGQPWQRLAQLCVQYERDCFRESPEKATYDHKMRQKSAEMHARRQAFESGRNQVGIAGGSSVPDQSMYRDRQNPIPQQAPRIGVSSSDARHPHINQGQPGLSIPQGPHNEPKPQPEHLTDADKERIQALAQNLMEQASEAQKQTMMQNVTQRLEPQRIARMRARGQDPLEFLFKEEATKRFMRARRNQMQQQGTTPNTLGMTNRTGSNVESGSNRPHSVSDDHEQMAWRHHPNHPGGVSRSRQRWRPPNAQGLACIVNKNTISRDNTIDEEAQEAIILKTMAKKTGRMAQQRNKPEVGNGERWKTDQKVRKKSPLPPPVAR